MDKWIDIAAERRAEAAAREAAEAEQREVEAEAAFQAQALENDKALAKQMVEASRENLVYQMHFAAALWHICGMYQVACLEPVGLVEYRYAERRVRVASPVWSERLEDRGGSQQATVEDPRAGGGLWPEGDCHEPAQHGRA
eukprot:365296-Chlamydomonas_euryale.AAC.26